MNLYLHRLISNSIKRINLHYVLLENLFVLFLYSHTWIIKRSYVGKTIIENKLQFRTLPNSTSKHLKVIVLLEPERQIENTVEGE